MNALTPRVVFFDSADPSLQAGLEALGFQCSYRPVRYAESLELAGTFEIAVIRSRFKMDRAWLNAMKGLRCIARVGAGMENIDAEYAATLGIACVNAPEGNRQAVAEQALGMLLILMNHLRRADTEVRNGIWRREENRGFEVEGKTIAIVGLGNNGSAFAKVLRGFDAQVIAYDPYKTAHPDQAATLVSMERVWSEADIVSLHVPLTEETRYLVNSEWLERFTKPIWLLNLARGKCLRIADLVRALDSGKVRGAALDVHEYESVSFEKNEAQAPEWIELVKRENVVLSPHIGGWTHESNKKMAQILIQKIQATFAQ
jgi:D-3-phosphoglycerate dehydrogenase